MLLLCSMPCLYALHLCTHPRVRRALLEASLNSQVADICGECFPGFLGMLNIWEPWDLEILEMTLGGCGECFPGFLAMLYILEFWDLEILEMTNAD